MKCRFMTSFPLRKCFFFPPSWSGRHRYHVCWYPVSMRLIACLEYEPISYLEYYGTVEMFFELWTFSDFIVRADLLYMNFYHCLDTDRSCASKNRYVYYAIKREVMEFLYQVIKIHYSLFLCLTKSFLFNISVIIKGIHCKTGLKKMYLFLL